jgi:2'-5' RNA ligase
MHLTLVFLGETAATRLPDLQNVVDRVAAAGQPQRSALGPLGCFPNARRPHVFWASLDQNPAPLQALHNALADNLIPLGWVRDARPFSPHITLGRVRRGARVVFPDLPPQPPPLTMEIDRIQLLSSRRGASGPHYRVLHTARLGHAT